MPGKLIVDEIEDSGGTSVIGRKNYIINGNFDIWERGTSETGRTSSGYAADRWFINPSGGTIASSQQSFTVGQTDVPNEPAYFYRFTNSVAADNAGLWQKIEGVRSLAGQTATISFYAKYTTNAPTSLNLDINQDFGSSGSADVATSIQTGITLTTSWQKFTYSIDVPSISGKTVAGGDDNIAFRIGNPNTEIWDMDIAQVQVEKGSVATDFEVRPIAEELILCKRYYQKFVSPRVNYLIANPGIAMSTNGINFDIPLDTEMRIQTDGTSGTVTKSGDFGINAFASSGDNTSGVNVFRLSKHSLQIDMTKASSTLSSYSSYYVSAANGASLAIDVEL